MQPPRQPSIDQRPSDQSLWNGLLDDGIPALATVAVSLAFAGGLAVYLGVTRQLLPHDLAYLGMTATEIEQIANGRVMDFMVHDRVSWGGSLFAVGAMYLWLIAFPLRQGHQWAWRTLAATGVLGFASFASHLPTGYLDTWHGLGTLLLVPVFAVGLHRTRRLVEPDQTLLTERWASISWGRRIVTATGVGLALSALVILSIGVSVTFVHSDLHFIGLTSDQLQSINPRLIPLIAHDRIGFAGGAFVGGLLIAAAGFLGEGQAARQATALAGLAGFGLALGIHIAVEYTDLLHLAPAVIGPAALLTGLILWTRDDQNPRRVAAKPRITVDPGLDR